MAKEMQKDIGTVSRVMKKIGVSKDGIMSFPEFRAVVFRGISNKDHQILMMK
ncbi:MAG: hypothetical protein CM15mV66_340 [uncultured marine virus]|nr:MAG: hypothetical protein CM15mV66_340 [uncultured marine virus]